MKRLLALAALVFTLPCFAASTAVTNKNTVVKDAGALTLSGANRLCFAGSSSGTACLTMPAVASSSAAIINAALGYTPANKALSGTETFLSSGTPGDYTLAKSGIVVKNGVGDEVGRIWFTDPDITNNFNSGNIFIGPKAGLGQTTTNTNASGFGNIGIGASALPANTAGSDNVAIGQAALTFNTIGVGNTGVGRDVLFSNVAGNTNTGIGLYALFNTTGSGNTAVGAAALSKVDAGSRNTMVGAITEIYGSGYPLVVTGNDNTFIGFDAGPTAVDTSNAIAIGKGVNVTASNRGVLGNASVTDFYFGSETAAANIHAKLLVTACLTVSTLPTGIQGGRSCVTDAVACTFMAAPVGSGSGFCPVVYNGAAWVAGDAEPANDPIYTMQRAA